MQQCVERPLEFVLEYRVFQIASDVCAFHMFHDVSQSDRKTDIENKCHDDDTQKRVHCLMSDILTIDRQTCALNHEGSQIISGKRTEFVL